MSMNRSVKLKPNAADLLIVAAVLLLAALALFRFFPGGARDSAQSAVVSIDGEIVERLPLSQRAQRSYTANGYTLRVSVEDGGVRVAQSDCPTQDCVHTGVISRRGQSIVCLPARLTVTIEGTPDGYDLAIGQGVAE